MKQKITIKSIESATLPILIISFFSRYYASTIPRFSELLTAFFALLGLCLFVYNKKCTRNEIYCFMVAVTALIYSISTEGARYFLLLCALITWARFRYSHLLYWIKFLVMAGLLTSIIQIINGAVRIEGYIEKSPPQFACVMLICIVYLLIYSFNNNFEKKSMVYAVVALVLSFFTGTRSVLIAGIAAFIYYFIAMLIQRSRFKNRQSVTIIILLILFLISIISYKPIMIYISSKIGRTERQLLDSNRTRHDLMNIIVSEFKDNPKIILIGNKAGYVEKTIKHTLGWTSYLPVHQDFILILAEFGIIGLLLLYLIFLKKHRAKYVFLFIFTVCSFHNILLNTRSMLLMYVVMCNIEYNKYMVIPQHINKRCRLANKNIN